MDKNNIDSRYKGQSSPGLWPAPPGPPECFSVPKSYFVQLRIAGTYDGRLGLLARRTIGAMDKRRSLFEDVCVMLE